MFLTPAGAVSTHETLYGVREEVGAGVVVGDAVVVLVVVGPPDVVGPAVVVDFFFFLVPVVLGDEAA